LAKGKPRPDLSGIYDLTILNQVLRKKGLQPVGVTGGLAEAIP
jgi:NitT/TauT family transport system substrate-binding protein